MATYILQKDYLCIIDKKPFTIKAGREFFQIGTGEFYVLDGQGWMFAKESVIDNHEWFKLKEEQIKVTGFFNKGEFNKTDHTYGIRTSTDIEPIIESKYDQLCNAIEGVLNGDEKYLFENAVAFLKRNNYTVLSDMDFARFRQADYILSTYRWTDSDMKKLFKVTLQLVKTDLEKKMTDKDFENYIDGYLGNFDRKPI